MKKQLDVSSGQFLQAVASLVCHKGELSRDIHRELKYHNTRMPVC